MNQTSLDTYSRAAILFAAFLIGDGAWHASERVLSTESPEPATPPGAVGTPQATKTMPDPCSGFVIADWAVDISDDEVLMGVSSHAFLGRVIAQVGSEGIPVDNTSFEIPETQFSVEVLAIVKGQLPERVTVSQRGGIDKERVCLEILENDQLLEPGEIVFFSTSYDPETGFYDIGGAGYGAVRAKTAAEQAAVIARFTEAAINEVDVDALVRAAAEQADADVQVRAERDRDDRDRDKRKRERRDRGKRTR